MLKGFRQRLLRVDLTNRRIWVEPIAEDVLRRFLGGSGLGAWYHFQETTASTDPLSPENLLGFFAGPATGTLVPTSGRHAVVARSPLTGLWGEADVGGRWGWTLKRAGYDGVLISGAADEPVYLWINDDEIEIRPAGHLWGKDTYSVDELIKGETTAKTVVGSIGPAGENLVKVAAIMFDGKDARAAGRTGLGAVMGSKKLKAIAVSGSQDVPVANPEGIRRLLQELLPLMKRQAQGMTNYGTAGGMVTIEEVGDLPIKNWQEGSWPEGAKKLSGQHMAETILVGRYYCASCVIGCGRVTEVKEGPYLTGRGAGPEYETLSTLGAMCLIDDIAAINYGGELCNRYGLDTISTGALIALAMEAYEKGYLSPEQTGGRPVKWGDPEIMLQLISDIAQRRGLGAILAEGVRASVKRLGLPPEFDLEVKGLELPAHDPRAYNSIAVGYATSNRGACHLQGFSHVLEKSVTLPELGYPELQDRFAVDGKGILTARAQDLMAIYDSLKMCKFSLFAGVKPTHMLTWLNYVTGWSMDMKEFLQIGERIFNLKRLYNLHLGVDGRQDTLPLRILQQKRSTGGAAENLPPLSQMLKEYYQYRGWDENGVPTSKKLAELGLEREAGS